MKHLISKITYKILILLGITLITTILWFAGLEVMYARLLTSSANSILNLSGKESRIRVEKEGEEHLFRVYMYMDGRRAHYPQKFETLLLPAVIIISWQLFSLFFRSKKQIILSASLNFGLFLAVQIVFLLLLTAYYSSGIAKYIYDAMMDSFYIIALILIIIDYIRYPVFQAEKGR